MSRLSVRFTSAAADAAAAAAAALAFPGIIFRLTKCTPSSASGIPWVPSAGFISCLVSAAELKAN